MNNALDRPKESLLSIAARLYLSHWRVLLAESLATASLMLFGCMSCIPLVSYPLQPLLFSAMGFGFVVFMNVEIFGPISGAHMNPAVTLGSVILGKTSIWLGIAYFTAQTLGAIIGYGVLTAVAPKDSFGVCLTSPGRINESQALAIEIGLTALLSFLTCAVSDQQNERLTDSNGIKFGLAIAGLTIAGGPLTGASVNPVRSLAPALWTGNWRSHWIYWVGPFVGSGFAAALYKFIWLKRQ